MAFLEVVETEVWKKIYEEGWRMWREGLDRLRKSENGLEAAKAKQLMDDAERILMVPTKGHLKSEHEDVVRYKKRLKAGEEAVVKKEFEESIKGDG